MKLKYIKYVYIGLGIVLFSGCSTPSEFVKTRSGKSPAWEKQKVLLSTPIYIGQINRINTSLKQFEQNVFVGKINFSGGYITASKPLGKIITSKKTEFANSKKYLDQAQQAIMSKTMKLFQEKGIQFKTIESLSAFLFVKFKKTVDYSKSIDERKDNVNLPRVIYNAPNLLPQKVYRKIAKNQDSKYLIIPVLTQYYSHNAGWFYDQEIGCLAGVRIAIQFIVYDINSRQKIDDVIFENKKIYPLKSSLNINESFRDLNEVLDGLMQNLSGYIQAVN